MTPAEPGLPAEPMLPSASRSPAESSKTVPEMACRALEAEDVERTAVGAAVVVAGGPHRQIDRAVAVEVAQSGHRTAEVVTVVEHGGEPALRVGDRLLGLDGPARVEEQHMERATIGAAVVIAPCPDSDVDGAVMIDVADPGDSSAESIVVVQGGGESAGGRGDLLFGSDGAVGVEEEHVDRAAGGSAVVVALGADHEIDDAVAVEVADDRPR